MKILVIPDVHLKPWMIGMAQRVMRSGICRRAVFLGDIADDYGQEYNIPLYQESYNAVMDFVRSYPETRFCLGNHDLSYLWGKRESGFSDMAMYMVRNLLREMQRTFPEGQVAYAHRIGNVIFSHAGITRSFAETYVKPEDRADPDRLLEVINQFYVGEMWKQGSPIWARPQLHGEEMLPEGILQVIGHTPVETPKLCRENRTLNADTFSTDAEGEPIGDQRLIWVESSDGSWGYCDEYEQVGEIGEILNLRTQIRRSKRRAAAALVSWMI